MLHRLLDIFHSFLQIAFRIIFARKAQVLFYYPQHFNRSAAGTNPFFDPLLQTCEEAGISYKLLEEPDWGTDKPRNPRAIKADAFFVLVLILRKLVKLAGIKDFYAAEPHVARLVNILTFGRLRYPRYVTISGSMQHLFLALHTKAIVYDTQHGVLTKYHKTFFDEHKQLRSVFTDARLHWLMWGEGYRKAFIRGEEDLLSDKVHVIGYPIAKNVISNSGFREKIIVISLQLTADYDEETLHIEKEMVGDFIAQLDGIGYKVLIKHHPRYNNIISVDDWFERYNYIEETKLPLIELVKIARIQLIVHSTTTFEFAEYGIPSFVMINSKRVIGKEVFYDDFQYPLYKGLSLHDVLTRIEDRKQYQADGEVVKDWYYKFYTPFRKDVFQHLITK